MRAPYRGRFDISREFVARRGFRGGPGFVQAGDAIDKGDFTHRRLRQLYEARIIKYPEETPGAIMPQVPEEIPDDFPERTAIDIPDDWRDMKWPQMRSLASSIEPGKAKDTKSALAIINNEQARRARFD